MINASNTKEIFKNSLTSFAEFTSVLSSAFLFIYLLAAWGESAALGTLLGTFLCALSAGSTFYFISFVKQVSENTSVETMQAYVLAPVKKEK